jgi:hypothetical protein
VLFASSIHPCTILRVRIFVVRGRQTVSSTVGRGHVRVAEAPKVFFVVFEKLLLRAQNTPRAHDSNESDRLTPRKPILAHEPNAYESTCPSKSSLAMHGDRALLSPAHVKPLVQHLLAVSSTLTQPPKDVCRKHATARGMATPCEWEASFMACCRVPKQEERRGGTGAVVGLHSGVEQSSKYIS